MLLCMSDNLWLNATHCELYLNGIFCFLWIFLSVLDIHRKWHKFLGNSRSFLLLLYYLLGVCGTMSNFPSRGKQDICPMPLSNGFFHFCEWDAISPVSVWVLLDASPKTSSNFPTRLSGPVLCCILEGASVGLCSSSVTPLLHCHPASLEHIQLDCPDSQLLGLHSAKPVWSCLVPMLVLKLETLPKETSEPWVTWMIWAPTQ